MMCAGYIYPCSWPQVRSINLGKKKKKRPPDLPLSSLKNVVSSALQSHWTKVKT